MRRFGTSVAVIAALIVAGASAQVVDKAKETAKKAKEAAKAAGAAGKAAGETAKEAAVGTGQAVAAGAKVAASGTRDTMVGGPENALSAAEQAEGWQLLFDGRTIDKWRGYRQTGVPVGWAVVEGTIARVGKGGDLITVEQFDNFELAIDFKIAPKGNSGIFYRGLESPTGPIYHSAPEYQVIDNAGHPDAKNGPDRYCGANYALDPPSPVEACKPAGEWNSARIVVNRSHVEHWLNGQKVVEYELGSEAWKTKVQASKFKQWPAYGTAAKGHIAIQDHGDAVSFKNVKIRAIR